MQPIFTTYDVGKLKKAKAYLQGAIRRCDTMNEYVAHTDIYSANQESKKNLLLNLAFINSRLKYLENEMV
jgi:hypothetical protein